VSTVVDEIAEEYLIRRPEGGRFFIDVTGAWYKDKSTGRTRQFTTFRIHSWIVYPRIGARCFLV